MIAVLVPVLGRPQNAAAVAESLTASTTVPHRLVWIASPGDDEQIRMCERIGGTLLVADWQPGHADFAKKINLGFRETGEEFVFQAADDVEFTDAWDLEVLRAAKATGAGVVGTNDDANPLVKRGKHSTHSLIRRSYVDEQGASMDGPGSVFSEAYGHQFVDNELVELARARGQWAFAPRAVVRHRHWITDRSRMDATYEKGAASARQDHRLFQQRRKRWAA